MKTTDLHPVFEGPVNLHDKDEIRAALSVLEDALRSLEPSRVGGRSHIRSYAKTAGKNKPWYIDNTHFFLNGAAFEHWCFIRGIRRHTNEEWSTAVEQFETFYGGEWMKREHGFYPTDLNPLTLQRQLRNDPPTKKTKAFILDYLGSIGITLPD